MAVKKLVKFSFLSVSLDRKSLNSFGSIFSKAVLILDLSHFDETPAVSWYTGTSRPVWVLASPPGGPTLIISYSGETMALALLHQPILPASETFVPTGRVRIRKGWLNQKT